MIAGVAVYFVRYEDEFLLVFRVEGKGGETVRDGSVRGQGAQEPINPLSLGGWKVFFLRGWVGGRRSHGI